MSHSKPQIDISYLNNFLSAKGKKQKSNEEFQRAKLGKILNLVSKNNWFQAQLGRANVEIYFNNHAEGIKILEDVLKKSDYKYSLAWDMLIDVYMQLGDLQNVLSTVFRIIEVDIEPSKTQKEIILHAIKTYLLKDTMDWTQDTSPESLMDQEWMLLNIAKLEKLNISLEIYRFFISNIYRIFYTHFKGTVEPTLYFSDYELVVRVNTTIDNAENLFEINNLYKDCIMDWYEASSDSEKEQIEKITVYFKHKAFKFNDKEASI